MVCSTEKLARPILMIPNKPIHLQAGRVGLTVNQPSLENYSKTLKKVEQNLLPFQNQLITICQNIVILKYYPKVKEKFRALSCGNFP